MNKKPKTKNIHQSGRNRAPQTMGPSLAVEKGIVPGIKLSADGAVGFSAESLPASTHFFDATHFIVNSKGESFVMLFGQKSAFSQADRYHLAVEIAMPRYYAQTFLHRAIVDVPSMGKSARPFIESVNESYSNLAKRDSSQIKKQLELPQDSNSFRRFSANYVTISLSGGQALIEFFEVPPDLLASVVHKRNLRKGAGAQSVISILTNVSLLKGFLDCVGEEFKQG